MPRFEILDYEGRPVRLVLWPAAGFVDAEIRCFMKPEGGYGETDI
jgi:hypothetical protein